jgi:hypothetical protein
MRRRDFVTTAAVVGAGIATRSPLLAAERAVAGDDRQYLELREYRSVSGKRMKILEDFVSAAMIPALKRMGVGPVGVFKTLYGPDLATLTMLVTHPTLESAATAASRLLDDAEVAKAGADYFSAPIDNPPFIRVDTRLLKAVAGMSKVIVPDAAAGNKPRIVELRTYESHNERVGRQKIEMINAGEVEFFRRNGAPPVFFAETLFGARMPSLSYMLAFADMAARDAGWTAFRKDPDWVKLSALPQYQDLVSNVADIILRPTSYSQI